MRRTRLSIKNISTGVSSNSERVFEEGSHATLTTLGCFYTFAGRAEILDYPRGEILLVLGKAEAELKVDFF